MSKLLIAEPPLQVLPSLAQAIGLNEAIIVQQIHYWIVAKQGKVEDGQRWIYNSYPKWQKQFPFWSIATIQRTFISAEAQGVIISKQVSGFDRQKLYTIDYNCLESSIISKCDDGQSQNDMIPPYQNDMMLTEIETTSKTTLARERTPRARTTQETELSALQSLFCELTGLPSPSGSSPKGKARDAALWYQPIRRIQKAANGKSREVLSAAIERMRREHLTIASPLSVEKVSIAVYGEMNSPTINQYPVGLQAECDEYFKVNPRFLKVDSEVEWWTSRGAVVGTP